LASVRSTTTTRTLWIYAVFINQCDISERAQQVKRMDDIYRSALRVVGRIWKVNPPGCDEPTWFRSSVDLPHDSVTWQVISGILRRPWFGRVWVVQEARLGNSHSMLDVAVTRYRWYY
ncbi:hypothetical protein BKA65DRAFT_402158, partial [Rhexocercosporidium sp. MPI-PUGE-AT-0058]